MFAGWLQLNWFGSGIGMAYGFRYDGRLRGCIFKLGNWKFGSFRKFVTFLKSPINKEFFEQEVWQLVIGL